MSSSTTKLFRGKSRESKKAGALCDITKGHQLKKHSVCNHLFFQKILMKLHARHGQIPDTPFMMSHRDSLQNCVFFSGKWSKIPQSKVGKGNFAQEESQEKTFSRLFAATPFDGIDESETCPSLSRPRPNLQHDPPRFSLHPGINVLLYRINASRVANYERLLFKRLFLLPPMSVSTVLLNLHQQQIQMSLSPRGG